MMTWKNLFLVCVVFAASTGQNSKAGSMWTVVPEYFTDLSSFSVTNQIYYELSNGFEPGQIFYLTFRLPPGHKFDTILFSHRISLKPADPTSTAALATTFTFEDGGVEHQFVQFKVEVGPAALDQIFPGDRFEFDLAAGAPTKIRGPFNLPRLNMTAIVSTDSANVNLVESNSALFACLNGVIPDASISGKKSSFKGKGIINKNGKGQTIKTSSRKGEVEFKIEVENDGGRGGPIELNVTPYVIRGGVKTKAFDQTGSRRKNITAALKRGKFSPQVEPGNTHQILLRLAYIPLGSSAPGVFSKTISIKAQSGKDSVVKGTDVNKAKVRLRKR